MLSPIWYIHAYCLCYLLLVNNAILARRLSKFHAHTVIKSYNECDMTAWYRYTYIYTVRRLKEHAKLLIRWIIILLIFHFAVPMMWCVQHRRYTYAKGLTKRHTPATCSDIYIGCIGVLRGKTVYAHK